MGANASHFVVNESWRPQDFITASESWYRENRSLHCTAATSRNLCIATIVKDLPPSYVHIVRGNHKSYALTHNYTYCSTMRTPVDREPTWAKLLVLAALHRRCRAILWVDADAIFTNSLSMAPHLALLKQRYHMLFSSGLTRCASSSVAVDEAMWAHSRTVGHTNPMGPTNAGAFFLRPSSFTEEVLHTLYGRPFGILPHQQSYQHLPSFLFDNGAINNWLRVVANLRYFRERVAFVNADAFNCMPPTYHTGCRILHAPGYTLKAGGPATAYLTREQVASKKPGRLKYERLGQLVKSSCLLGATDWRQTRCGQTFCNEWSIFGCQRMSPCVNSRVWLD